MNFFISRKKSLENMEKFIDGNLKEYSKTRNFDLGPNSNTNPKKLCGTFVSTLHILYLHGLLADAKLS